MSEILDKLIVRHGHRTLEGYIHVHYDEVDNIIKHIEKLESLSHTVTESECAIKAHEDEPVFILLGRDAQAPAIVRLWSAQRAIAEGPNDQTDAANKVAEEMEKYRGSL